jgi:hypothetical protein
MSPSERLFPDDLAPAGQQFFIGTRWRVDVFCDCGTDRDPDASVLVKSHEWISTPTAEAAIESVRAWGYTDAVRYVAERVEEVPR